MFIAKIENNQVVEVIDYREKFSGIPSDELLAAQGYKKVNLYRDHDRLTQKLVQSEPVIEGEWVYTVEVQSKSAEEIAADVASKSAQVRAQRDALLSACDWTQLPDVTIPKKAEWATYRQALRDVPAQAGFPWNIQWPIQPE